MRELFICFLLLNFVSFSQQENDQLKIQLQNASVLLEQKNYKSAVSSLKKLHKKEPDNPRVKYYYAKALSHCSLDKTFALNLVNGSWEALEGVERLEAKILLAELYHVNYQFDQAIELYQHLDTLVSLKTLNTDYKVLIAQCHQGKKIIKDTKAIEVKPVKSVKKSRLAQTYNKVVGKKIAAKRKHVPKLADLISFEEKKVKEDLFILEIDGGKVRMYPEYKRNKNGKLDKDIVYEVREAQSIWYDREFVGGLVNNEWDQDYPFLGLDGKTLYFSSNGPQSMGGYDLFKCERDSVTGYWGKPVNLGFPINSTEDEFLFVPDSAREVAYFSSTRFAECGEVTVYELRLAENYQSNVSVYVNSEIKGMPDVEISEVQLSKYDDHNYLFSGVALPLSNRLMYSVGELERLTLNVLLSDSTSLEFTFFSTAIENPLGASLTIVKTDKGYCLQKSFSETYHSKAEVIKLLTNALEVDLLKQSDETRMELGSKVDSINFSNLAQHHQKVKQEWLLHESWFYSFLKAANHANGNLNDWLTSEKNLKEFKKKSSLQEHLAAEDDLNKLIGFHVIYELEFEELKIYRKEKELFDQIVFVEDSLSKIKDEQMMASQKEKLFAHFKTEYEKLKAAYHDLYDKQKRLYKNLNFVKLSLEKTEQEMREIQQKRASRNALLKEEKGEALRQYNNAWWRRRKRKIQRVIDGIDAELQQSLEAEKMETKAHDNRRFSKQFVQHTYAVHDWKYRHVNAQVVSENSYEIEKDIIDSLSNFQIRRMKTQAVPHPSIYKILVDEYEKTDSMISTVTVNELSAFDFKKFQFESAQFKQEDSTSTKETLIERNDSALKMMAAVEKELLAYDEALFQNHTVEVGQTIYAVARRYNCSVEEIKKWNKVSKFHVGGINWLDSSRVGKRKNWLYVGETLRVMRKHTVVSGESLKIIAQKYNCLKTELKTWNTKSANNPKGIDWSLLRRSGDKYEWLYVGEKLIVTPLQ